MRPLAAENKSIGSTAALKWSTASLRLLPGSPTRSDR
uniref:Uncharacterized protein n=1 Tax=Manihot esculenta TaxID=3983 RepID=A0A2C9V4L5_MANES